MISYRTHKPLVSLRSDIVKLDWSVMAFVAIVVRVLFINLSWYSYFALIISLSQFILLFLAIGKIIPVRYMFGSLMCLQMFIGPVLAYNGLDQYQYEYYKMRIPEAEYFSYVIPAVLAFIAGLHVRVRGSAGETV